jgi:CRISPR system Cascade subunit CasA
MTLTMASPQTQRTSFSLLTEPWIPVVFSQSLEYKEISLQDLFLHWDELQTVQAANPPRTIALWRWLIAFAQWSIQGPATVADWAALWNDKQLGQKIVERLETISDRLDLLHPVYPFAQCLNLLEEVKETSLSPSAKLLYHDKDTGLLWTHFSQWTPAFLTYAEAAQELIRLLCCDLGGTKSDAKDRSAQSGSCIMTRIVMPIGDTVRQTILLNLHQYDPRNDIPSRFTGIDVPLWQRPKVEKKIRSVVGLLDYLTFPNRRVLFAHNGYQVTGAYLYRGEELIGESSRVWDLWQAFKDEKPLRLNIHKASWRDSEALLHPTVEKTYKPRIFDWLVKCRRTGFVPDPVSVQVLGFAHGKDQGKPLQWIHDTITIPQIYLDSEQAYRKLVEALSYAERVGGLFSKITYAPVAAGMKLTDDGKNQLIRHLSSTSAMYWSALNSEFQRFIFDLAEDKEVDEEDGDVTYGIESIPEWKNKLKKIATDFYEQSLSGVPSYEARAKGLNAWHKKLYKILEKKP